MVKKSGSFCKVSH